MVNGAGIAELNEYVWKNKCKHISYVTPEMAVDIYIF